MISRVSISDETQSKWHEFESSKALQSNVSQQALVIQSLWEQSQFCMRLCHQFPQWLDELVDITEQQCGFDIANIQNKANEVVSGLEQEELFKQKLREFRNKSLLQVCWKDLVLQADIFNVLEELSAIAKICVSVSADWLKQDLISKYGTPRDENGEEVHFVVIAMGKLGGKELNFSSDIDVMFCFSDSGITDGKHSISNQEFFTLLGQKLIRVLSDVTADGFVYRVDCRLRPFGDSGPLVVNFNHVEDYLQTHGREWERYAFIKARVTGGD